MEGREVMFGLVKEKNVYKLVFGIINDVIGVDDYEDNLFNLS